METIKLRKSSCLDAVNRQEVTDIHLMFTITQHDWNNQQTQTVSYVCTELHMESAYMIAAHHDHDNRHLDR